MNVGICVGHAAGGMRERFGQASAAGFQHCQLISWTPSLWTDSEAETIRDASKDAGVTITAFWCGWEGPRKWNFVEGPETLGIVPPAFRYARVANLCDGADFARKIGVTDVVSHMGFLPETQNDPNFAGVVAALRFVAEHLRAGGQRLLFETGQETPVALLRVMESIGTDNLGVNLDPANLIMYGKANPVDALDVLGRYVFGVHAKDGRYPVNGTALGPEVRVGEGKVDFPALLKGLRGHGFDGSLTIEREISGEQQRVDIEKTQVYLRNLIETL